MEKSDFSSSAARVDGLLNYYHQYSDFEMPAVDQDLTIKPELPMIAQDEEGDWEVRQVSLFKTDEQTQGINIICNVINPDAQNVKKGAVNISISRCKRNGHDCISYSNGAKNTTVMLYDEARYDTISRVLGELLPQAKDDYIKHLKAGKFPDKLDTLLSSLVPADAEKFKSIFKLRKHVNREPKIERPIIERELNVISERAFLERKNDNDWDREVTSVSLSSSVSEHQQTLKVTYVTFEENDKSKPMPGSFELKKVKNEEGEEYVQFESVGTFISDFRLNSGSTFDLCMRMLKTLHPTDTQFVLRLFNLDKPKIVKAEVLPEHERELKTYLQGSTNSHKHPKVAGRIEGVRSLLGKTGVIDKLTSNEETEYLKQQLFLKKFVTNNPDLNENGKAYLKTYVRDLKDWWKKDGFIKTIKQIDNVIIMKISFAEIRFYLDTPTPARYKITRQQAT